MRILYLLYAHMILQDILFRVKKRVAILHLHLIHDGGGGGAAVGLLSIHEFAICPSLPPSLARNALY